MSSRDLPPIPGLTSLQHEKCNDNNKTFFFFFAKHLRVGDHLLLSCKQAKRTGQKGKKNLASRPHQLAQISARPLPQRCGEPGDANSGPAFCKHAGVHGTTRNSCREQEWYSRL